MEIQVLGSTKPQYTIKKEEAILFSGRSAGIVQEDPSGRAFGGGKRREPDHQYVF